jgi:hypothetical protein
MPNLVNQLTLDRCPHCNIAKPLLHWTGAMRETTRHAGDFNRVWKSYFCNTCGGVILAASRSDKGEIIEMYPSGSQETFDYDYLPKEVADDFREALSCYSSSCFNAFAAMCRRTVQSMSANLGAHGKDKVLQQLKDLKDMAHVDNETFEQLKQIVVAGHDGAHPHLPKLNPDRAGILLELMKDVLYQLYVRKEKIKKAMELRSQTINQQKDK